MMKGRRKGVINIRKTGGKDERGDIQKRGVGFEKQSRQEWEGKRSGNRLNETAVVSCS